MDQRLLTAQELCAELSIDRRQLRTWIAQGLPRKGCSRRHWFDPHEVAQWLIQHEKAETTAPRAVDAEALILRTEWQVARHFNVSERTVQRWLKSGMPGQPSNKGRQDGLFSVAVISGWLTGRGTSPADDVRTTMHARLHKARAELIELEVGVRRGRMIEAEEITRRWVRSIHEAKAQLGQLAVKLTRVLPDKYRAKRRAIIARVLNDTFRNIEATMRRQADEQLDGASLQ